jgi:hypothetical protein
MPSRPSCRQLIKAVHCFLALTVVGASVIATSIVVASSSSAATPSSLPWVQQSPATIPPGSSGGSMAYDPASGQMVLLGGYGDLADTWTYDGTTWTQHSLVEYPNGQASSMAYDPAIGKIVLFSPEGGCNYGTWTWDGATWTPIATPTCPSADLSYVSLAYDPAIGQMVLFGGRAAEFSAETWTFSGTTWSQQSPTVSPSGRAAASMDYDPAIGRMVLFGGTAGDINNSHFVGDTWTYDGTTWSQQSPGTSPLARAGASMAYDPALGEMVLFGGGNDETFFGDTWIYDGTTWMQQSPSSSPAARGVAQMAYDGSTNKMVFFGGFTDGNATNDDMWVYPGSNQSLAFTSTAPTLGIRGGSTYAPTATSSSGLDVTVSLDATSTGCTFDGSVVTFAGAGTCVVDANQAGNDEFGPAAQVQQSINVSSPGPYSPMDPVRICDTRAGNPSNLSGAATQCDGLTIPTEGTRTINVANGSFGVPADATAVVLNVTVVNPTGPGYVTAFPAGAPLPNASSVNYVADEAVPNLVEVGTGAAGQVSIYASAQTDVVVDVEGYVAPTASGGTGAGLYDPLPSPVRICDTREGNPSGLSVPNDQCNGMTLASGGILPVKVANINGIPTGATAAVFNVTVVNPKAAGYLTVYPEGGSAPLASNVNYDSGQVTSNRVIVPLSAGSANPGAISVLSSASADVVVDVSGYYSATGGTGTQFAAEPAPVRICDTRSGNPSMLSGSDAQCNGMTLAPGGSRSVQVSGLAGVPSGATAVTITLAGISPSAPTFLLVYPNALPSPLVSDLNEGPGDIRANMVVATLSSSGTITIANHFGNTDVVVDVLGWYS